MTVVQCQGGMFDDDCQWAQLTVYYPIVPKDTANRWEHHQIYNHGIKLLEWSTSYVTHILHNIKHFLIYIHIKYVQAWITGNIRKMHLSTDTCLTLTYAQSDIYRFSITVFIWYKSQRFQTETGILWPKYK